MAMSKTNRAANVTMADVATALGCKEAGAKSRLVALGYVEVCSRCAGSGHFSRCQQYGTMCFGCSGSGKQMAKLTAKLIADAKARQDAGELDAYFARNRAIAAAKKEIEPLAAEARAVYTTISDAYTRAGKVARAANYGYICDALFAAQGMNNALYWGGEARDVAGGDAVRDVEHRAQQGKEDAVSCVAKIRERIADLTALRDAAAPHLETWIASPKPRAE